MGAIVKFSSSPVNTADLVPGDLIMAVVSSNVVNLVLAICKTEKLATFLIESDIDNARYQYDIVLNKLGTDEVEEVTYSGFWQWRRVNFL